MITKRQKEYLEYSWRSLLRASSEITSALSFAKAAGDSDLVKKLEGMQAEARKWIEETSAKLRETDGMKLRDD